MKKYIVMALLAVAFSQACKKDKETACKPAKDLIIGTWNITEAKTEYFYAPTTADVVTENPRHRYVITTDKIRRENVDNNNVDFINPYTFTNDNVLTFKGEGGVEQRYEVSNLTNEKMQWRQVNNKEVIYSTIADQSKKAAKQVITIDFTKSK